MQDAKPLNSLWPGGPGTSLVPIRDLLLAARNVAWGVEALHAANCVLVDLTPANVLVKNNMLVAFVDADSFQFSTPDRMFRSTHGRGPYTAPEVLNSPAPEKFHRGPRQDCWALSTLIFQLLVGCHPFTAHYIGAGRKPSQVDRIKAGLWAYAEPPPLDYEPSPFAAPLGVLPKRVEKLMRKTLQHGYGAPEQRPSARRWKEALNRALRDRSYVSDAEALRAKHHKRVAGATPGLASPCKASNAAGFRWRRKATWVSVATAATVMAAALGYLAHRYAGGQSRRPHSYSIEKYGQGKPTPKLWTELAGK